MLEGNLQFSYGKSPCHENVLGNWHVMQLEREPIVEGLATQE